MNINDKFIRLYNEFEVALREKYDNYDEYYSVVKKYEKEINEPTKSKVKLIREMRNLLVHSSSLSNIESFDVSEETISFLEEEIYKIKNPLTAYDICIKKGDLLFASLNSSVLDLIDVMSKSKFSHVPVLNNEDKIIGVFSENTIFQYVYINNGNINISSSLKVRDLEELIKFSAHRSEQYKFIKKDEDIKELEKLFTRNEANEKRVVMLFVTEHGLINEKLLGIITPFDLVGK